MADYQRWYVDGGTYFFTVVTYRRQPLFREEPARRLLGEIMREVAAVAPFQTVAAVLLWDHLRTVWTLPAGDHDYSGRWKKIKSRFTSRHLAAGGGQLPVSPSKSRRRRRGVWQPRFWEHTIRDEQELEAYCDYIHYNPVKHGLAKRPWNWTWSTFRRFVAMGQYEQDWGCTEPPHLDGLDLE